MCRALVAETGLLLAPRLRALGDGRGPVRALHRTLRRTRIAGISIGSDLTAADARCRPRLRGRRGGLRRALLRRRRLPPAADPPRTNTSAFRPRSADRRRPYTPNTPNCAGGMWHRCHLGLDGRSTAPDGSIAAAETRLILDAARRIQGYPMNVEEKSHKSGGRWRARRPGNGCVVDPNLHTDTRMHISNEITELLRTTHEDLCTPHGREADERTAAAHDHQVASS